MEDEVDKKGEEDERRGLRGSIEKVVNMVNGGKVVGVVLEGGGGLVVGMIEMMMVGLGVVIVKIVVIVGGFVLGLSMVGVFEKEVWMWLGSVC